MLHNHVLDVHFFLESFPVHSGDISHTVSNGPILVDLSHDVSTDMGDTSVCQSDIK